MHIAHIVHIVRVVRVVRTEHMVHTAVLYILHVLYVLYMLYGQGRHISIGNQGSILLGNYSFTALSNIFELEEGPAVPLSLLL